MQPLVQEEFEYPRDGALADEPLVIHQHSGLSECENLVVFVHGLGGERYGRRPTWGHFPDLLFHDLPKVDIGLYSYVSLLGRIKFWQSVTVEGEARVLAGILRQASTYKRVILIGHSMGGLVCQAVVKYLVESGEFPHPPHISGLILMATPQAGSVRVPWFARHFTTDGRALAAHGALVTQLQSFITTRMVLDESTPGSNRFSLPTWAVWGASDFWVDRMSANLGLPEGRTQTVRGTHTSIVKPATRDDDAFRFVAERVKRATQVEFSSDDRLSPVQLPARDGIPAVGLFLDRIELRSELGSFVADRQHRLFVLAGPPGWGKHQLAAKVVDEHRSLFDDVVWIDCTEAGDTASVFLGRLHGVLSEHGDTALEGLWRDPGPDALGQLLAALNRKRYLIVFHRIDRWLDTEGLIRDTALRTVLMGLLAKVNSAKLVMTSSVVPKFDPTGLELPVGTVVERLVGGLDPTAAVELLRASGLHSLSEDLLQRVAVQYTGMPAALRVFAEMTVRNHRDPEQILRSTEVETALDNLLRQSLGELPEDARALLDRLSVLRRPIERRDVERLYVGGGLALTVLMQRFLVEGKDDLATVRVSEAARRICVDEMTAETSRRLHRAAAHFYAVEVRPVRPGRLADAEAALEEVFHLAEADDVGAAAEALWWAGPTLLAWGYVDTVHREASRVAAAAGDDASTAHAAFLLGEVADLRGDHDNAIAHYEASKNAGIAAEMWSIVTLSLSRLGRVASARGRLTESEAHLNEALEVGGQRGIAAGLAGALLSLGWIERQRGASADAVIQRFSDALTVARESGDPQAEASAHRELGFMAWTRSHDEKESRRHFEEARTISERENEVKELGAVHATLGYLELQWGDTRAAIDDSWAAVRIAKRIGDIHMLATAYDHLGQAWEARGDLQSAEEWYRRSLDKTLKTDNPSGRAVTTVHLGRVLRKQGRLEEASTDLHTARQLVVSHGLTELMPRVVEEEDALTTAGQ